MLLTINADIRHVNNGAKKGSKILYLYSRLGLLPPMNGPKFMDLRLGYSAYAIMMQLISELHVRCKGGTYSEWREFHVARTKHPAIVNNNVKDDEVLQKNGKS